MTVFVALAAAPAHAAYPGANGKIAFVSSGAIWTVNPDGSGPVQITSPAPPAFDADPSWSADGTRIAFSRGSSATARDIYLVNPDGTDELPLATGAQDPTWSPDALQIGFVLPSGGPEGVYVMNSSGTNRHLVVSGFDSDAFNPSDPAWAPSQAQPSLAFDWNETGVFCDPFDIGECEGFINERLGNWPFSACAECWARLGGGIDPDWSPTGLEIAHETRRIRTDWDAFSGVDGDIAAVDANGNNPRAIVTGPETDSQPAWSPDGTKIVFRRGTGQPWGLWVVGADGSNPTQILGFGSEPDWQPAQRAYPRPVGTGPHRASLVTAFEQCSAPNREHGPPLAYPSCNPPSPASPNLVVSAGEVRAHSVGFIRHASIVGVPGPPDDSDIRLRFRINNVMNRSDLSDYTGIVRPEVVVRLTDRDGAFQKQTTQDFPFGFDVPCAATASTTEGGVCDITTTADAVSPGSAAESTRAIWAFDQVKVYDGGPAGDGENASLFAVQGVFIP